MIPHGRCADVGPRPLAGLRSSLDRPESAEGCLLFAQGLLYPDRIRTPAAATADAVAVVATEAKPPWAAVAHRQRVSRVTNSHSGVREQREHTGSQRFEKCVA